MGVSYSGSGGNDRVVVADAASIRNLTSATYLQWLYHDNEVDATYTSHRLCHKGLFASGYRLVSFLYASAQTYLGCSVVRATTDAESRALLSNFTHYGLDKWLFVAATHDTGSGSTGDQRLLVGDLDNAPAEPSAYVTQTVGSGTVGDNTGVELCIGNRPSSYAQSMDGIIATTFIYNTVLSNAQIIAQWDCITMPLFGGCVYFCNLGLDGTTGTQPDWSGNRNNGTVTGAVAANHVPIAFLQRYQTFYQSVVGPTLSINIAVDNYDAWKRGVRIVG